MNVSISPDISPDTSFKQAPPPKPAEQLPARATNYPDIPETPEKKLKKRIILSAILAFILLMALIVPLTINKLNEIKNREQSEDDYTQYLDDENEGEENDDSSDGSDDSDDPDDDTYGCTTTAEPDPEMDFLTYTLPDCASPLRLSLPASLDDIFFNEKTGITGFGVHAGGHIEGLDHVWIELKPGTPVKSWADGTVEDVRMNGDEFHVRINYGRNLVGTHMEVQTVYVDEGDRVTRGQEIGLGMSFDPDQSSAEFSLVDEGRIDGVSDGRGVYVSPFDYLDDTEKELLVEAYKEHVLDPYRADNRNGDAMLFYPYQPYLTNSLLIHNGNEGTITGEWLLREEWNEEAPNDLLTFIEADNEYYEGNIVLGMDDESEGTPAEHSINGTFTVDYDQGTLRISDESGKVYFARFSIDDSRPRAILTIQIQTGSYPASFTDEALEYVERDAIPRRMDGVALGVLENE